MDKMHRYFIDVLNRTAELSTCTAKAVGALLVDDNRIIAIGYNGVSSGKKHCNLIFGPDGNEDKKNMFNDSVRDKHHEWSHINEIHAEENLLGYAARKGIKTEGTIMYVSLSPCIYCAKSIVAHGIKKVLYLCEYDKDKSGIEFLKNNNIEAREI